MNTSLGEAEMMIVSLDAQINTLESLKKGEVPSAPQIKPQPINVTEPEIEVVEVGLTFNFAITSSTLLLFLIW